MSRKCFGLSFPPARILFYCLACFGDSETFQSSWSPPHLLNYLWLCKSVWRRRGKSLFSLNRNEADVTQHIKLTGETISRYPQCLTSIYWPEYYDALPVNLYWYWSNLSFTMHSHLVRLASISEKLVSLLGISHILPSVMMMSFMEGRCTQWPREGYMVWDCCRRDYPTWWLHNVLSFLVWGGYFTPPAPGLATEGVGIILSRQ